MSQKDSNRQFNESTKRPKLSTILNIKKYELKKIIPLCIMAIMMTYIYNTLRSMKDAMIIPIVGAELISTLKLWGILPFSILFVLVFSKLTNVFSKKMVFLILSSFFVLFFLSFAFIIYPYHESLHPDLSSYITQFPRLEWPLKMISNWTFSLFYIIAETCGNVTVFILFWQLVNDVNTIKDAKKYYAFFILISHTGHVLAGISSKFISATLKYPNDVIASWGHNLQILTLLVCSAFAAMVIAALWIHAKVITDPRLFVYKKKEPEAKIKLTVMQSLKVIMKSRYIGLIAAMIFCYGVSINLVEGIWKSQVKLQYPTSNLYSEFMGNFQIFAGSFNMVVAFIGAILIRKTSWLTCALVTPVTMLISGLTFFALVMFREELNYIVAHFAITVVFAAVIVGSIQNIVSKGVKYSIFDMTKEISYIPLSEDLKTKGKAAVDLIGHKLGKSGGGFIQWALLTIIPGSTLMSLTDYFFTIFAFMMCLWVWSVISLNKEFLKKSQEYEKEQQEAQKESI